MKLSVAVIAGGPSVEAEVSRRSARGVVQALQGAGHEATVLELDEKLPAILTQSQFEVAFPVTHGPMGEDGCLQGALEVLGLPYVGSGVLASAAAAHKPTARRLFQAAGLPVASAVELRADDPIVDVVRQAREVLGERVVIKPAAGGSGLGVTRIDQPSPLERWVQAVEAALANDEGVLIEEFCAGLEVTCGVLEVTGKAIALPPTQIEAQAAEWYDFKSRYGSGGSVHRCPAPFSEERLQFIQELAVAAHRALGARDLSRVDCVVGESRVTLLELNTLPGMTPTSLYPEAAAVHGVPFPQLCDQLVRTAVGRIRRVPTAVALPE